jgi:predicted Zn-dependent protease
VTELSTIRRPFARAPHWRAAAVLVFAFVLASCAGTPLPGEQVPLTSPQAQRSAQPTLPVASREHQRILAAYGGAYSDAQLEGLVVQTVERLVAASERPGIKYRVTILNSPAINAFALPSGQIYVTRGLLALANDTSELASVLAHEMAHVIADHAAIRANQARHAAVVSSVVSDVLSDPMAGALALAKSKISLASFSRAQELEADGIGVGIAARAGYDPYGAARFLASMGRNADLKAGANAGSNLTSEARIADLTASHPATPDRVTNAQINARQYVAPGAGERDRAAYLARIDGLVYGEDPAEGFVRGRRFIHPRLGFAFTAPEGFALDNTAQAVLGVKDGGTQAMRLDVVRIPAEQTLAGYLTSGWLSNVDASSVQELTINGFPAATATAGGDPWSFRLYVVRFGSEIYRFIYATKTKSAETDRHFRSSIETFRRLTLAEIQTARPLRIKTLTVKNGDTVESLAAQMTHVEHPAARFRVLNGLAPTARLKSGDLVKVLIE